MSQYANSRKSYPHVPKQSYDRQPMHYIRVGDDGSYTTITRAEFFSLIARRGRAHQTNLH
jgi:hypothetical protein